MKKHWVLAMLENKAAVDVPLAEGIKCDVCGKLHDYESDTFITIAGDVYLGATGGLVGGNFSENGKKLFRVTTCCRTRKCFNSFFNEIFSKGNKNENK